jgi:hypothetical protein
MLHAKKEELRFTPTSAARLAKGVTDRLTALGLPL